MRHLPFGHLPFTIYLVIGLFFLAPKLRAQSNLTYDLKVGTTGEVSVVKDFPESYAAEKVNIKVRGERLEANRCIVRSTV